MRLTLVIGSMGRGGAEHVLAMLANAWVDRGHAVTLVTLDGAPVTAHALAPGVAHLPLHVARASRSWRTALRHNGERIRSLRRAVAASAPDSVLSFMDRANVLSLLATRGLRVPTCVAIRGNPAFGRLAAPWRALRHVTYPLASRVIVQTSAALASVPRPARRRAVVIPNPVPAVDPVHPRAEARRVVAMGRLVPEKGFHHLVRAFARVAVPFADWDLVIFGEGPERTRLEAEVASACLGGRVHLPGHADASEAALRSGDVFVLSSVSEGFPNVLGEALALGLPCVATDCAFGPRDLVRPGIDGELVPPGDPGELASVLSRLMGDAALRRRLAARAPEVSRRFSLERVLDLWDAAFRSDAS